MKKGISISVIAAGLVFAVFTNAFASEKAVKYADDQITSVPKSFIDQYKIYESGDVISVTDTLDDSYFQLVYKNGKVVLFPDHSNDDPTNKDRTVEVYYEDYEEIRGIEDYYEYKEDIGEERYIGSLELLRAEALESGSGWIATFSGKISKSAQ